MTTITIQVDNEQHAELLEKMLRELSFVADIDVKKSTSNLVEEPSGSYQKIKKILDKVDAKVMFKEIEDPSTWQRNLRNEW
ncbi:MAG: hypothetical protein EOO93_06870 [Pedobacter sp.]|nr:MAG: hypothetical protein EOO93_06870 [Pedobacter sp.]